MLTNKPTVKQNYLAWTHIDMCEDSEEVKKDSKVGAARRDQTVRQGAPTLDVVTIYTLNHVY